MDITEVRVELANLDRGLPRVLAYCSVTFDNAMVIRNFKLVETTHGITLAMPSRKVEDNCLNCGRRGPIIASYCGGCGIRLLDNRAPRDVYGKSVVHADVAHPITKEYRAVLESAIRAAYESQLYSPEPLGIHAMGSEQSAGVV